MLVRNPPSGPTVKLASFLSVPDNVNVGNVASIDWSKGPAQRLTVGASCSISSLGLPAKQPTWVQLKVVQGGAGSFVPFFLNCFTPGGTPLTFSTAAGAVDIVSLYWDGQFLYAAPPLLGFA